MLLFGLFSSSFLLFFFKKIKIKNKKVIFLKLLSNDFLYIYTLITFYYYWLVVFTSIEEFSTFELAVLFVLYFLK
jgi:hypothetical protein